jgi:hypothetical protein
MRYESFPGSGFSLWRILATDISTVQVPSRAYSWSIRMGCPGLPGIGAWTSPIICLLDSSIQTNGVAGS